MTLGALSTMSHIPLPLLFSDQFMKKHTIFTSYQEFIECSTKNIVTLKDFEQSEEGWDEFLQSTTTFSGWREMTETALDEYYQTRPFGPFPII